MRSPGSLTVLLLSVPLLAGCIGLPGAPAGPQVQTDEAPPRLSALGRTVEGTEALVFNGTCTGGDCGTVPLELTVPDGHWDDHAGALEVAAQGIDGATLGLSIEVRDGSGAVVAESTGATYAAIALLDEPAPGSYEAKISASSGDGDLRGVLQLDARPLPPDGAPAEEVLPNLVMMPPKDLHLPGYAVGAFGFGVPANGATDAAGLRGCDVWEAGEQAARQCLRFTTSVGNLGEGFLEVHLTFEEGAKAMAGQGRFFQRVFLTDGTHRDVPVDGAEFHPTHAHFHYRDLAVFRLYDYDIETEADSGADARGDQVAETGKSGFCFFDMGLVVLDHVGTTPPRYASEANCFLDPEEDWVTGVSPGWFDRYWASLSDQYVEVTDLPDGTYELVVEANGGQTLVESSYDDNRAGAVFRLEGDRVEVLWTWADYLGGPPTVT